MAVSRVPVIAVLKYIPEFPARDRPRFQGSIYGEGCESVVLGVWNGHIRTVPIPEWVKSALDHWTAAAGVTEGRIFRAVARAGKVWGNGISQNVVWYVVKRKRLTNTPVRQAGSVLKCPDDRKNRVVSAQTTYPCGSSAVGGRVCEQRHAPERVLPESRFELQHAGSPSEKAAVEEKA